MTVPDPVRRARSRPASIVGVVAVLSLATALTGFVLRPPSALSPRFNHVMLYVSDLDASIAFYTQAFDLEVTQRIDALTVVGPDGSESRATVRMAFLKFPGQEFVFELSEQEVPAAGASAFYQHVGVDVMDIEAAAERALAAGAREYSGVRTVRTDGGVVARNAFFRGPDGELVELMEMVAGEF
ncbi:MAG: VOC family protein [Longimicrobiales bacterium]